MCAPENYPRARSNMDPARSSWQGSEWSSMDMYPDHGQAWYSQPAERDFELQVQQQVQRILQQPGFQADPKQPVMGPSAVLWPSGAGQRDSWQANSWQDDRWQDDSWAESWQVKPHGTERMWYQAPAVTNLSGPHFDASSRCIMSTGPPPLGAPKKVEAPAAMSHGGWDRSLARHGEELPEAVIPGNDTYDLGNRLKEPMEKRTASMAAIAKKEAPVDEEFERDVTKAVMEFLEGGDLSDEELEDGALLGSGRHGVANRTPAAKSEAQQVGSGGSGKSWTPSEVESLLESAKEMSETDQQKFKLLCAEFSSNLQKMFPEPSGGGKAAPETVVKLLELLVKDAETQPPKDNSPAVAKRSPKQSLLLESLVCSSPAGPLEPELQKGQWIGVMLKNKPLPMGITAGHMALLGAKVEDVINQLGLCGVPSSLSNIQLFLRKEGVGSQLIKAVWNLCHIFPRSFCLWVPDVGEMSLVLLDKPLPPVEDEVADQLHTHLADEWRKLKGLKRTEPVEHSAAGVAGPPGPLGPESKQLAEDLATKGVTTLMMKNVPTNLKQPEVLDELHRCGFEGRYDFFYLPSTFQSQKSLGYAFVNLVDVETMKEFAGRFHNSQHFGSDLLKISAADVQGQANAQKIQKRMRRIRNANLRPVILESKDLEAETR